MDTSTTSRCPSCGAPMDATATSCPRCHAPRPTEREEGRSGGGLWLLILIIGAGLVGVVLKLLGLLD